MYSVIQKQKAFCKAGDFIYKNKDTIYPILSFAASNDPALNKLSGRLLKCKEDQQNKDFYVSFLIPVYEIGTEFCIPDVVSKYLETKLLDNNKTDEFVDFTINFLKQEISRCEMLGLTKLVIHPGSHVGLGEELGLKNIVNALNVVLSKPTVG
jgi:hypothetical protein